MSDASLSANREAEGTWQPIETAPKGRHHAPGCLLRDEPERPEWDCACPHAHVRVITYGPAGIRFSYQDKQGQWRNMLRAPMNTNPTHWMPLPEPPIPATPVSGA